MKIGMITDCMKKANLDEALKEAHNLHVDGVQIFAVGGEFSPESLTQDKKTHYKNLLKEYNLSVSALCADFGGYGFEPVGGTSHIDCIDHGGHRSAVDEI